MIKIMPEERIKDLRVEHNLKGKQLSELIEVPESTYNGYELGNEIPHSVLMKLSALYGVTTDYLLGLSDNRDPANADYVDLHLQDETIALLKSGTLNNRLICEIIEHEEFPLFLVDTEVYIGRWMENYVRALDLMLLGLREKFMENCGTVMDADTVEELLQNFRGSDDDYFAQNVADHIFKIVYDIKEAHHKDVTAAPMLDFDGILSGFGMDVDDMIDNVQNPNAEDMFAAICRNYDIDGSKATEEELKAIMKFLNRSKLIKAARKGRMPEKLEDKTE